MATIPEQIEIGGKQVQVQKTAFTLKRNVFGVWTLKSDDGRTLQQVLNYPKSAVVWLFVPTK